MASLCYYHPTTRVAEQKGAICAKCKACKHESLWRNEDEAVYHCAGCFKAFESTIKAAETWVLTPGGWEEQ